MPDILAFLVPVIIVILAALGLKGMLIEGNTDSQS